MLFVCEEAHRYASADRNVGFGADPPRAARIAKEGRKYGVCLGLVTQRPAELDPTIISQCSTLFAMRMANDRDQALLRSAVSDAAANLVAFVPSLGTREVVGFGEGFPLPTRLKLQAARADRIPRSETFQHALRRRTGRRARLRQGGGRALARRGGRQDCGRRRAPAADGDSAPKSTAPLAASPAASNRSARKSSSVERRRRRQAGDCGSWRWPM